MKIRELFEETNQIEELVKAVVNLDRELGKVTGRYDIEFDDTWVGFIFENSGALHLIELVKRFLGPFIKDVDTNTHNNVVEVYANVKQELTKADQAELYELLKEILDMADSSAQVFR